MTIKTKIREFWDLLAGAADFYSKFHYPNHRRIRVDDSLERFEVPLPVEAEFVYEDDISFPFEEYPTETITLNKWSWQWVVNDERRIYTANIGIGIQSDVIAYNNFYMAIIPWPFGYEPSIEERLYYTLLPMD